MNHFFSHFECMMYAIMPDWTASVCYQSSQNWIKKKSFRGIYKRLYKHHMAYIIAYFFEFLLSPLNANTTLNWRAGRVGSRCWRRTRHISTRRLFLPWDIIMTGRTGFSTFPSHLLISWKEEEHRVLGENLGWHQTPHHIVFGFLRKRRWWRRNGNMFSLLLLLAYRFKRSPVSLYRGNKQYFLPFLFLRRCNTPWMIWGIVRMLKRWIN